MHLPEQFKTGKILVPLGIVAVMAAALVLMEKGDAWVLSKNKAVKLVGKIGQCIPFVIVIPLLVPSLLAAVCVLGVLVLALFGWIASLFSKGLADSIDHVVFSDWPLPLRLLPPMATGGLAILCYWRMSRVWERRRAVEEEIKPVLGIQIGEPPSPSGVERFFGKDGPPDRLFNRCFGWIENIQNDSVRLVVGFLVWTVVALPVGGVAMWLQRAQIGHLALWEGIPVAFLYGSVCNFLILAALAGLGSAARNVRVMRTWMEGKLPRRVILPYRSWQLRRIGRNRWPYDPLAWLLTLVAIALMTLAAVGAWQLLTHARGGEDDSDEVTNY